MLPEVSKTAGLMTSIVDPAYLIWVFTVCSCPFAQNLRINTVDNLCNSFVGKIFLSESAG